MACPCWSLAVDVSNTQSCLSYQIKAVDCRIYGNSDVWFPDAALQSLPGTVCTKDLLYISRVAGCPVLPMAISHPNETVDHVTTLSNNCSQHKLRNPLPYSPLNWMVLRTGHRGRLSTLSFNCNGDSVTVTPLSKHSPSFQFQHVLFSWGPVSLVSKGCHTDCYCLF